MKDNDLVVCVVKRNDTTLDKIYKIKFVSTTTGCVGLMDDSGYVRVYLPTDFKFVDSL